MKYRMIGYGGRSEDKPHEPRGVSSADNIFELAEQIAYAMWVDKCAYVTIDEEKLRVCDKQ